MKLCGFNATCFKPGKNQFGCSGFNICRLLNKRDHYFGNEKKSINFCAINNKRVESYETYDEYMEAIKIEFNNRMKHLQELRIAPDDIKNYICNALSDLLQL